MSMENIRDLFLEDETFEDARNKFNTVFTETVPQHD